jgi:anti-sigma regulatory factor (Ser/Thr protein kinase)
MPQCASREDPQMTAAAAPQLAWSRAFAATPTQVRNDAILCISELATNSCLHSASREPGGQFTVHAANHTGYAWIEVTDDGGPWQNHPCHDGRKHGLGIVSELAADWGIDGSPSTGWTVWARLEWT